MKNIGIFGSRNVARSCQVLESQMKMPFPAPTSTLRSGDLTHRAVNPWACRCLVLQPPHSPAAVTGCRYKWRTSNLLLIKHLAPRPAKDATPPTAVPVFPGLTYRQSNTCTHSIPFSLRLIRWISLVFKETDTNSALRLPVRVFCLGTSHTIDSPSGDQQGGAFGL
jgi:hypothetical protein